jgi:outer membrane protein OmpU
MNIKKIGLTALAGSLAMFSANAAELVVSGKTELTYITEDKASTGNPYGFGNEISFSASGDVNGITATYFSTIADGGTVTTGNVFASSSMTLDMGDMGLVAFDQGTGAYGVATIDDKMPYAYEEANYGTGGGNGQRADSGHMNTLAYVNTLAGYTLNFEYNPGTGAAPSGDGSSTGAGTTESGYSWALTGSPVEGLNAGIGYGKEESTLAPTTTTDEEYSTVYATYAIGGATIGYQIAEGTGGAVGTFANQVEMYGVSFSVNENLAISYNVIDNKYAKTGGVADVTEESRGVGASYTMGSAAVRVVANSTDNIGGALATNEEIVEVSLMLSF